MSFISKLSGRECDTVLAGLRCLQEHRSQSSRILHELFPGKIQALTDQQIDKLCEKLNYATEIQVLSDVKTKVLLFRNHYRCPKCGAKWDDVWSCACNDECPNCNEKDIEPERSTTFKAGPDDLPKGVELKDCQAA